MQVTSSRLIDDIYLEVSLKISNLPSELVVSAEFGTGTDTDMFVIDHVKWSDIDGFASDAYHAHATEIDAILREQWALFNEAVA